MHQRAALTALWAIQHPIGVSTIHSRVTSAFSATLARAPSIAVAMSTFVNNRCPCDRAALIRAAYAMELGHGWPAGEQAEAA